MPKEKKNYVVKTYLSEKDYNELIALSEMAGLSLSAFTRKMCFGLPVETRIDRMTRLEVTRLRGDIGKLGGLLKQALVHGADKQAIYAHLKELDVLKDDIRQTLERLV